MDILIVEGNGPLNGTVPISGSKNAALPILIASMLMEGPVYYTNVPRLRDIGTTLNLLKVLGCPADMDEAGNVTAHPCEIAYQAPYDLVRTMRASALCLGPLLARLGRASVALPGGCAIGARPVDMHLTALEKMGATFNLDAGYIEGSTDGLKGAHIAFPFPTVGGTENLLMAASLADGTTVLENSAREPEVCDLAEFLIQCGAKITGHGTSEITIEGVPSLRQPDNSPYRIMSDRIEAGTYLAAACITRGEVLLKDCPVESMEAVIAAFEDMGAKMQVREDGLFVSAEEKLSCVDVKTLPYPGFPTDMQAQIMAVMTLAEGSGVIEETIFENRFMHVQELVRMGARIKLSGRTAIVRGVDGLAGAPVMASDLRASASLVVAALAAHGVTAIRRIYHLDRGYENIDAKLNAVGAKVRREQE